MPRDFTISEVMHVVRTKLNYSDNKPHRIGFLLSIKGRLVPKPSDKLKRLHAKYGDSDGFLYLEYSEEEVFG